LQQQRQIDDIAVARMAQGAEDPRLEIIWRLPDVADQVTPLAARLPNSQMVVVGLIDDLFDLRKGEREETVRKALRTGITFNALVYKKSFATRFFYGSFNKIFMRPRGLSLHAADYMAEQTGGEVASVGRPDDLAAGLERFITSLMARYNLGFTLGEHEQDDGRVHRLEVKVKARDARGKERQLAVKARRGYFMSESK
jgi:hypothetical protein